MRSVCAAAGTGGAAAAAEVTLRRRLPTAPHRPERPESPACRRRGPKDDGLPRDRTVPAATAVTCADGR
nr:MAG: hypothetical protein DIU60_24580 [Actinomycetota bacterium]